MKYIILFSLLCIPLLVTSQEKSMILKDNLESLIAEQDKITEARKAELVELAALITSQIAEIGEAQVNFICTHNSRRSQLSELWFRTAVEYYELNNISSHSGGTESTAFNHRMVEALKRFGFTLEITENGENPVYQAYTIAGSKHEASMFSKKYSHQHNPKSNFIAVMVCSDADKNCPVVLGASYRFSLPYIDPKISDNTTQESVTYDAKVREIGRELLFMSSYIKQ